MWQISRRDDIISEIIYSKLNDVAKAEENYREAIGYR